MAFHVSCPITCRRICYCKLGFPPELRTEKGQNEFMEQIGRIEAIMKDPSLINGKPKTVQVLVPKVIVSPPSIHPVVSPNNGDDAREVVSSQIKRASMQRNANSASVVAEDYVRRFESGDGNVGLINDLVGDEQGLSNAKVMCRLCFTGENEGSEKAKKMLSCKSCSKKYHRSCMKSWSLNRDLFHWSSWTCPSCRTCEGCRRTGDPNKLMLCKRCDGAYHSYCQQPPHKNVSNGPYLCPKHTRCHSCASTVPGNGLSVRWFLGYTCCDACGRLFVKGNYCPVCLKVYRDSESTPMVCCDVCQRWVHCHCDGISDEKYLQFQVDNNLQYRCATCRGECYQVRDLEDAVQELWRRRDKADRELTASLRAAAGLPTQEEIFSIQPYSDDEDNNNNNVPSLKNEYGRPLKFSLKGVVDKTPKKKSASKKYGKKKGFHTPVFGRIEGHGDAQSTGYITGDNREEDVQSYRSRDPEMLSCPGRLTDGVCLTNQAGVLKQTFGNEVLIKMNNNRPHGVDTIDETGKLANKFKNTKGPKLVIHLGARNKNVANSPRSDASNLHQDQELTTSNGSEDMAQRRANEKHLDRRDTTSKLSDMKGKNLDQSDETKALRLRGKEGNTIKIRKLNLENSDVSLPPVKARVSFGKRSAERNGVPSGQKVSDDVKYDNRERELKPLLKLKFKNPYSDNQTSWAPSGEDDKSSVKGQRSKRKRPSPFMDKTSSAKEDEGAGHSYDDQDMMDEIMDANWIIQKLGKDAIGKKVEVHQQSNNTWHKGSIIEVLEGTSIVSVTLDDGKTSNVDLSKQGIRFVSQKQRW